MPELLRRKTPADVTATRRAPVDRDTLAAAARLLDELHDDDAVVRLAVRFGDLRPGEAVVHDREALAAAHAALAPRARDVLARTAARVAAFARSQRAALGAAVHALPGGAAGHDLVPVERAGCYAPGGRFPLPSSVLMTAITARVAGVDQVWVASPRPAPATLAAAHLAGADGLLALGGVQAIHALARGFGPAGPADVIAGPGNRWVTAAKQLLAGSVGIDMLAGPSELVVLADDTADPSLVAADLLAQAEHDDDALPVLVTTHAPLIAAVERALGERLADLATAATARVALANGFCVLADGLDEALAVVDRLAPEHLELMLRDPSAAAARVRNAGALFLGSLAAEVLGDYGAGPNHVLPTGGTARFTGGLSVLTFLRMRTWLRIDDPAAAAPLVDDAVALADIEGLQAHARSAASRRASR
ncbi:MAG: histidinol dehydrogenase [Myxococcales bacterium]|nr:histidinol dehydrogenase [Myxococcales bacterium]